MFDSSTNLALGLLTGIIFGFLLQKGRAAKYHVIVGQFLLKEWTVVKIMATAILVGSVGVYGLVEMGYASLEIKPALLGGVLIGAVCFGIGIVIFGYCPGTSVAACGEGRRDAMVGVLGMLFGAGVFVALYPMLQPLIKGLGDMGKISLADVLDVSPWLLIGGMVIIGALILWLLQRNEGRIARAVAPPAAERRSESGRQPVGTGSGMAT